MGWSFPILGDFRGEKRGDVLRWERGTHRGTAPEPERDFQMPETHRNKYSYGFGHNDLQSEKGLDYILR